jgi:hypothetical protein
MAVRLRGINPRPPSSSVVVDKVPANEGDLVYEHSLVETTTSNASVGIDSDGQWAATVSGTYSKVNVYSPPTISLDRVYYRNSYRYKLRTPGGYVGIRG